jgi:hypothetical protein
VTAPAVAFYISGHGFGHAVRQIAILRALLREASGAVRVLVRSSAPAWLFERTLRAPYLLLPGPTDTGVMQIDGLRLDERATVREAASFYANLAWRVAPERALLEAHRAALVVADAPPLACLAAAAADIPAFVCSNFTWDWIYRAYFPDTEDARRTMTTIREAYRGAGGWRLPMHGGFETVDPVIDVPLVARHANPDRSIAELRIALGLPAGVPLALASFGGYGARNLPLDRLDCLHEWGVVLTTTGSARETWQPGIHAIPEARIYARGLQYEDLVRAVDVVVTKPGYGIVSDCAANGTAMLYTSRGRFPEYDVLVREMPRWVRAAFVPQDELMAGRWQSGLEAVRALPPLAAPLPTDGAEVVAALILKQLGLT